MPHSIDLLCKDILSSESNHVYQTASELRRLRFAWKPILPCKNEWKGSAPP